MNLNAEACTARTTTTLFAHDTKSLRWDAIVNKYFNTTNTVSICFNPFSWKVLKKMDERNVSDDVSHLHFKKKVYYCDVLARKYDDTLYHDDTWLTAMILTPRITGIIIEILLHQYHHNLRGGSRSWRIQKQFYTHRITYHMISYALFCCLKRGCSHFRVFCAFLSACYVKHKCICIPNYRYVYMQGVTISSGDLITAWAPKIGCEVIRAFQFQRAMPVKYG